MIGTGAHFTFTAGDDEAGRRLDQMLVDRLASRDSLPDADHQHPSRSQVAQWIQSGLVSVDGVIVTKAGMKLQAGMEIRAEFPQVPALRMEADPSVPFKVVFEDESILIVDKPAGVIVHPGAGAKESTLVHGLLHHFADEQLPQIGDSHRPGLVHRLDKDTTGLMVIAKTERAFHNLVAQLKPPRTMSRVYLALTNGLPRKGKGSEVDSTGTSGKITLAIGRHPRDRVRMAALDVGGKEAETLWRAVESFGTIHLCEVTLGTGRTHQIRVHFSACRAPLLGDPTYTAPTSPLPVALRGVMKALRRQALHAATLSFLHPSSGTLVRFEAPLPEDFASILTTLRASERTAPGR